MRILIAEDETEIAKAIKVILEKNKYTAVLSATAKKRLLMSVRCIMTF